MILATPPAVSHPSPNPVVLESCVNCGRPLSGPFCAGCGERRASDRDFRFGAFVAEAFHTVTSADGSLLRSLKILLTRPGALTAMHMRGRRVGLVRPLQLFLMVNVVYFIWATGTGNQMLMTTLPNHMNRTWHGSLAKDLVSQKLEDGRVTAAEYDTRFTAYRRKFEAATAVQSKSLIVVMVPAFALLAGLLHFRRRDFAVKHLVYSLHIYSAFLLMMIAVTLIVGLPITLIDQLAKTRLLDNPVVDTAWGLAASALFAGYLYRSLRVAYDASRVMAAVGAILLMTGMVLILFSYRTLLFLTTYLAT